MFGVSQAPFSLRLSQFSREFSNRFEVSGTSVEQLQDKCDNFWFDIVMRAVTVNPNLLKIRLSSIDQLYFGFL